MIKPERKKKEEKRKPTRTSNKMTISTYLSIIPLYVNRKNVPIKRHGVADQIKKKKKDPTICCLQETHFSKRHTQTESDFFHFHKVSLLKLLNSYLNALRAKKQTMHFLQVHMEVFQDRSHTRPHPSQHI